MDGTTQQDREARLREPSPFVAEVEGRLRVLFQGGGEPMSDPAEERRALRRRDMEIVRLTAMESALHINEYICSRLPGWKREPFEKITDPVASLANLNRAIVQMALAEDRFDESAEDRSARIKAEAEAKAGIAAAALAAQTEAERTLRRAENKRRAHGAIRAIALDYIRLPRRNEREELFTDLFGEWEAENAYDGDPAEIVADACARLALTPRLVPDAEIKTADGEIDPAARRKHLVAFTRKYIDLMTPADPGDDRDEADTSAPPAQAQGPPH